METVDSFEVPYGIVDSYTARQIEKIAESCKTKFSSASNFVSESLGLYIMWWTEPEMVLAEAEMWYPHMTDEQIIFVKKMMKNPDPKAENPDEVFEKKVQSIIDKNKKSLQPLPFHHSKPGELRIDIDSFKLRAIEKIISEGDAKKRYSDWHMFFQEAISLFTFYWTPGEIPKAMELMYSIWPYIPEKNKMHWKNDEVHGQTFEAFLAGRNQWCKDNKIDPDALPQDVPRNLSSSKIIEHKDNALQDKRNEIADTVLEDQRLELRDASKAVDTWYLLCDELDETKGDIAGWSFPSKTPADSLPSDDYPLVWSFYSRLLPVKIVLTALADMISDSHNNEMVRYFEFREVAYESSLGLAEILKQYETRYKIKRNEKISTGFPLATFGLDMNDRDKARKVQASKERFLEHFVGMKEEAWVKRQNKKQKGLAVFDGALNAMGLVHFKAEEIPNKTKSKRKQTKYELKVGLTSLGAEFVQLSNPIFESYQKGHWKISLSDAEVDFILNRIIPRFPLEHFLVNRVVSMLDYTRNSQDIYLTTDDIDKKFEIDIRGWLQKNRNNSYAKPRKSTSGDNKAPQLSLPIKLEDAVTKLTPWRVATMGRLGEMKIVDWKLERGTGKSQFYPHQSRAGKVKGILSALKTKNKKR